MCLNRLDDRPQSNSRTIAPDYFLCGDRSSCDGTFFLKVNRDKLSQCEDAKKPSYQVDSFRKYVGFATAFVKYAGWVRAARMIGSNRTTVGFRAEAPCGQQCGCSSMVEPQLPKLMTYLTPCIPSYFWLDSRPVEINDPSRS